MHTSDDDDDDDGDAVSYTCIAQSLHAIVACLVRSVACCQWMLLNVRITRHYSTLFKFTVQKYIYPSASKVRAGSFRGQLTKLGELTLKGCAGLAAEMERGCDV